MVIVDQYCYVSSGFYPGTILIPGYNLTINKIDISDVYNPILLEQIEYTDESSGSMFKFGDYLIMKWYDSYESYYDFYTLPNLEYVGQVESSFHHHVVNDTIISAVNSRNITFWNIHDASNWQYISRYTLPGGVYMSRNKQYLILEDNVIIFYSGTTHLISIADIDNPILIDSYEGYFGFWGQAIDSYGLNFYAGFSNWGIQHFEVENNSIEHLESIYDYERFFISCVHNNKMIASKLTPNISPAGYYLFDFGDPLDSNYLGEWFDDMYFEILHKQGNWMVLKDPNDHSIRIYDITDFENPIQTNSSFLGYSAFVWSIVIIDENEPDFLYILNFDNSLFRKYDVSQSGEMVELFEYQLPISPCSGGIAINNSIAYITYGEDNYNLLILDGLVDNNPNIANDINSFNTNYALDVQEGYLICRGRAHNPGQVFSLDDPLNPVQYFEPQWGDEIDIHDDLIFAKVYYIVGVYENRANSTEPITIFNGLNYIYNINLLEHEGTNYIITNELANIGLFEYTYIPSAAEDEMPKTEISLSNYPNPFNPETTIQFNLIEDGEVQLNIYNIKGQKIKSLLNDQIEAGQHSVVWNGEDTSGKKVGSGLYLYKLRINDKTEIVKKCMLLK